VLSWSGTQPEWTSPVCSKPFRYHTFTNTHTD